MTGSSADVERLVDPGLREAVRRLQEELPGVPILLAGSAGTGESTRSAQGWHSDLEIGIVGGLRLRREASKMSRVLSQRLRRDVCVFWVRPQRLRAGSQRNFGRARPNLHAFNLARAPVIGSLPSAARPVKMWESHEMPPSEGLVVLLNRVGEMLSTTGGESDYLRAKLLVACGDALLVASKRYEPTYSGRRCAVESALSPLPTSAADAIRWGYQRKLDPGPWPEAPQPAVVEEAVDATVRRVVGGGTAARQSLGRHFDSAPWRRTLGVAYTVVRARQVIPLGSLVRLLGREPLEARIYSALLERASGGRLDVPLDFELERVAVALGEHDEGIVRLWRAVCY